MLKIYGSMLCKDCVQCCADLDGANVSYQFCDFADELVYLKEFLAIRDSEPVFDEVKKDGRIGIPCILSEDGRILTDWSKYVGQGMPDR